ncbi:MAG: fibronectin type III domain-containing protein [Acidobacteriota bacterium]|nr:fibronectin type III domain-containing protein [Acidobacteriota bacterium]
MSFAVLLTAGCASPGKPLPPSLQIPRLATDLTADRTGDDVHLHWTTPGKTMDGVAIGTELTAEICSAAVPDSTAESGTSGPPPPPATCGVVHTAAVRPGPAEAVVRLPGSLASGPPALVAYAVELRGPTGKTAGPGSPAYVAAGAAPEPVRNLRAANTSEGALLQWTPEAQAAGDRVELERSPIRASDDVRMHNYAQEQGLAALLAKGSGKGAPTGTAAPSRLTAGPHDAGGVLDRTAEVGTTYSYRAQRVRRVEIGGRTLELRSPSSDTVSVTMRDIFPPATPLALVAAPGAGSIDLSWEPGADATLPSGGAPKPRSPAAGYRVYRRDGAGTEWQRLNPEPVPATAYRDLTAVPGQTYAYRVTAVDAAGNESSPGNEAVEHAE